MEELRPENLEELVQELAGEQGAPDAAPQRVRVCPKCGKCNSESAWHCSQCSATLSIETLTDKEAADAAKSKSPGAGEAASLSPSELILLNGEKFARTSSAAVKFGEWVTLAHIDTAAHATELGEMMLAAAFLANEKAGAVRLEVRQQEMLFGLLKRDKLYMVPGEHAISWPRHSFESQMRGLAGYVSKIIYNWWMRRRGQKKSGSPWSVVCDLVFDGLVSRGLLQEERKTGLKGLFAGASYVLPAETAALATQQSLEPVRELLVTCRSTRPEVWDLLIDGIDSGIGECREPPDWD